LKLLHLLLRWYFSSASPVRMTLELSSASP
jgi:hypothetical protein